MNTRLMAIVPNPKTEKMSHGRILLGRNFVVSYLINNDARGRV